MNLIKPYAPLFYNPPPTRYFLLTGGRGSAKSFHLAVAILNLTYEAGHTILFTRYTLVSANKSIIPEFVEKINLLQKQDDFEITKDEITNKITGTRILFSGIKTSSGNQTANLKSIQGLTTWVLEEAEELVDESIFDSIDLSVRLSTLPNRVIIVMNPSNMIHFVYKRWIANGKRDDTTYIHTTYEINMANLSQDYLRVIEQTKNNNYERYLHLFQGHWIASAEGLLWTRSMIERCRIEVKPETLKRIVVAIDPATTANKNSDETGIVVVGIDGIGNGYVLEDKSGKWTPAEWGIIAVQAAKAWQADCIIAETNQGGDMVQQVIRTVDKSIRYKGVHATKGKYTRAEPIYNLYELGKVYHVGHHPLLELQMTSFNPNDTTVKESPDRVDALVWGLTELMLTGKGQGFVII